MHAMIDEIGIVKIYYVVMYLVITKNYPSSADPLLSSKMYEIFT